MRPSWSSDCPQRALLSQTRCAPSPEPCFCLEATVLALPCIFPLLSHQWLCGSVFPSAVSCLEAGPLFEGSVGPFTVQPGLVAAYWTLAELTVLPGSRPEPEPARVLFPPHLGCSYSWLVAHSTVHSLPAVWLYYPDVCVSHERERVACVHQAFLVASYRKQLESTKARRGI